MDKRVIGNLIGGFAVKAIAAAFAIYVAVKVASYVVEVFSRVNHALPI